MMLLNMNFNENRSWFEILIMFNWLNKQEVLKNSRSMTLTYAKVESHIDGTE